MLSTEAKQAISRIDTHTYGGSKRGELKNLALSEGKNLWMSEVDGKGTAGTNAGNMEGALWLAERITTDCNGLNASAWILWQLIDNHVSSVGYNGNKDSGMPNINTGFWGVAVADHDKNEVILSKKYYAFGQFSRYIRPGMIMLNSSNRSMAAFDKENGRVCSARVVVFEDYRDRIKNAGGSLACVGAVVTVQGDQTSFVPMMVCEGVDSIMLSDYGWHNISKEQREYMSQNMSLSGVLKYAVLFLNTWYGIQIALLHPTVRTIFSHPRTEAVKKHQKSKKRKRVTRYVKKHIIRYEDIQTAMYGNHKNTLVWYVIGHWRHYTNGKKVFVQPYWKGTLRELKMNLDDRKRIIGGTL